MNNIKLDQAVVMVFRVVKIWSEIQLYGFLAET